MALPGSSAIAWYPIFVAKDKGFFKDEGLDVTVQSIDGSGPVLQAMTAGRAEFGAAGPGPYINGTARGGKFKFFYNLYARGLFVLVTQEKTGIKTAEGIKGKVLGVATADGGEVSFARSALGSIGLTGGADYKVLTIGEGGAAVAGFTRGDIDAYSATFVNAAILQDKGIKTVDITPQGLNLFGNGLVVREDIYKSDPKLVAGFAKAISKALEWGMQNKDEVLKISAKVNPQEGENAVFARTLLDVVIRQFQPEQGMKLGETPEAGWKRWHDSLVASKELQAPLADLSHIYTNEFVK
jgi:NitT/TauT family transport system substrate-binding protein